MKYIIIVLLLPSLFGCFAKKPEKTGMEGKILPSFKLLLPDSSTYFNTISITTGKPTTMFYFGPHCPYSRTQMEEIIKNMSSLKDMRFLIFTTWPFEEMKGFYEHYNLKKYPNIITGIDFTNFFQDYFKAPGVPYIAIYGKDNRLRESFIGNIDGKQIKAIAEN